MIQVHINHNKVEKIVLICESDREEDFDQATWQTIRPLVNKIDKRLQRVTKGTNADSGRPDEPSPLSQRG